MFFVTGLGALASGICVFSLHKIVKIGVVGDISNIENPWELCNLLDKNFDDVLRE